MLAVPSVLILLVQVINLPRSRALLKAGISIAARMAIIAITTSSSINVKHLNFFILQFLSSKIRFRFASGISPGFGHNRKRDRFHMSVNKGKIASAAGGRRRGIRINGAGIFEPMPIGIMPRTALVIGRHAVIRIVQCLGAFCNGIQSPPVFLRMPAYIIRSGKIHIGKNVTIGMFFYGLRFTGTEKISGFGGTVVIDSESGCERSVPGRCISGKNGKKDF